MKNEEPNVGEESLLDEDLLDFDLEDIADEDFRDASSASNGEDEVIELTRLVQRGPDAPDPEGERHSSEPSEEASMQAEGDQDIDLSDLSFSEFNEEKEIESTADEAKLEDDLDYLVQEEDSGEKEGAFSMKDVDPQAEREVEAEDLSFAFGVETLADSGTSATTAEESGAGESEVSLDESAPSEDRTEQSGVYEPERTTSALPAVAGGALSEEKLEEVVARVVQDVVERVARETMAEVAEKLISEAIESLKRSLESA